MLSELESKIENNVMRDTFKLPAVGDPMYVLTFSMRKLGDLTSAWKGVTPGRLRKVISYNLNMYACKKSDKGIVPTKPSNNGFAQRRGGREGL